MDNSLQIYNRWYKIKYTLKAIMLCRYLTVKLVILLGLPLGVMEVSWVHWVMVADVLDCVPVSNRSGRVQCWSLFQPSLAHSPMEAGVVRKLFGDSSIGRGVPVCI